MTLTARLEQENPRRRINGGRIEGASPLPRGIHHH